MAEFVARDIWQSLYDLIRQMIMSGELAPGARLYENELAERFGTSRGPVRAALKELERNRLVVIRPRRGAYVRSLDPEDLEEILSLMRVLYPLAIERAVERMTDGDIARFRQILDEERANPQAPAFVAISLKFHRAIFELAHHERLREVWESLEAQSQFQALAHTVAARRNIATEAAGEYDARLFAGLADRDAGRAIRAVTDVIDATLAMLHDAAEERGPGS